MLSSFVDKQPEFYPIKQSEVSYLNKTKQNQQLTKNHPKTQTNNKTNTELKKFTKKINGSVLLIFAESHSQGFICV